MNLQSNLEIINKILSHRLKQSDIISILNVLSNVEKEKFLHILADVLEKVAAILDISTRMIDSNSLNNLLALLIKITTETVKAERGTIFLYDSENDELFSRVMIGNEIKEIRFKSTQGIAGAVFHSGEPLIINDAYSDLRFNIEIDKITGYKTRNIICAPIKIKNEKCIGVIQLLNKSEGSFNNEDLGLLDVITSHAAAALQNANLFEQVQKAKHEETYLLEITTAISSELQLKPLLQKIMETIVTILDAERATLFLYDEKTNELWSTVALGLENKEIRIPSNSGIAGYVFQTGETINIADAYSDPRFNPEVDKKTGFTTRSILCMPVVNRFGKRIGVAQVLNKKEGNFNKKDEKKLKAFCAQASIAIENAKLFEEVVNMKNYNECILESLNSGVITVNANGEIVTTNSSALKTLGLKQNEILGKKCTDIFISQNQWISESIYKVLSTGQNQTILDTEILRFNSEKAFVNLNVVRLLDSNQNPIGAIAVFEDITKEKRLKGALSRYMPKEIAEKLTEEDAVLGGQIQEVTVLFSDIRDFSSLAEAIGPQETVAFLNAYFSEMVEVIFQNGGILDKYIGDAILSVFGTPFPTGKDADDAVTTAIQMRQRLNEINKNRVKQGLPKIKIGIGINTDKVLVGNIGSIKRMDYTVIGDGVNLASRLESACKYYKANILISEMTYKKLKQKYLIRIVDQICVKGKQKPVRVYEVLAPDENISDNLDSTYNHNINTNTDICNNEKYLIQNEEKLKQLIKLTQEGIYLYQAREFDKALTVFNEIAKLYPYDFLANIYIHRCKTFITNPPPPNWDGVWVMQEK